MLPCGVPSTPSTGATSWQIPSGECGQGPGRMPLCGSLLAEMQEQRAGMPLSPHPHPQAPPASLARLHTKGWPCPPVGLPGLAQLWHSPGHGQCPGGGQAAGWAEAQLLHTAGRALHRGGFSLPAHVVTRVTPEQELQAFLQAWGMSLGALRGHQVHSQAVPSHRSLCHGAMLGCACSLLPPLEPSPPRNKDIKMLFFMTLCFVLGGHGQLQQGAEGHTQEWEQGLGTGSSPLGVDSNWEGTLWHRSPCQRGLGFGLRTQCGQYIPAPGLAQCISVGS